IDIPAKRLYNEAALSLFTCSDFRRHFLMNWRLNCVRSSPLVTRSGVKSAVDGGAGWTVEGFHNSRVG
ncbi:MAG TPA: hypothetical protein PLQ85_12910, partial [Anaerolineae bacterium]|nr:hypothetical protein [Anaerolineae bacterium]